MINKEITILNEYYISEQTICLFLAYGNSLEWQWKKDVNWDFHISSSLISQSSFFEEVRYLILASLQRKLRGYIEV